MDTCKHKVKVKQTGQIIEVFNTHTPGWYSNEWTIYTEDELEFIKININLVK